ncbi:MAG: zinc ribbon domain-containing protein [Acetivibrionales bacterium]
MFFIGIFGSNQARKQIGTHNNAICPSCGSLTRIEVFKAYSYFHVFFIPTFRWNTRYYARAGCCGTIYGLDPEIGRQFERGLNPEIRNEHLHPLYHDKPFGTTCSRCGARSEPGHNFCPYCGSRL